MCPQISSFAVTPNYEILFFSSDMFEVVNILDFFDRKIVLRTIMDDIEKFKIGGESNRSAILLEIRILCTVCVCLTVCVCVLT